MKKYDPSIPRNFYWANVIGKKRCPRCNLTIAKGYSTYGIAVITGEGTDDIELLISGNDGGYFCSNCDTVVLDDMIFNNLLRASGIKKPIKFLVLGTINIDAIPPEKRHLPIGEDDNPAPVVYFKNLK